MRLFFFLFLIQSLNLFAVQDFKININQVCPEFANQIFLTPSAIENLKRKLLTFDENQEGFNPIELSWLKKVLLDSYKKRGIQNESTIIKLDEARNYLIKYNGGGTGTAPRSFISDDLTQDLFYALNRIDSNIQKKLLEETNAEVKSLNKFFSEVLGWKIEDSESFLVYEGSRKQDFIVLSKEKLNSNKTTMIHQHLLYGTSYTDTTESFAHAVAFRENVSDFSHYWRKLGGTIDQDYANDAIIACKYEICITIPWKDSSNEIYEFSQREKEKIMSLIIQRKSGSLLD